MRKTKGGADDATLRVMGYTDEQIKDAKAAGHTEINPILDYLALKTRPYKIELGFGGESIEGTLISRYDTISYVELARQVEPNADGWRFAGSDVYYTDTEGEPLTEKSKIDMNESKDLKLTIVQGKCLELTSITKGDTNIKHYCSYVLTLQFSDDMVLYVKCKESEWPEGKSTYSITGPTNQSKMTQSKMTKEQHAALQNYEPTTEFIDHKRGILDQLKPSA